MVEWLVYGRLQQVLKVQEVVTPVAEQPCLCIRSSKFHPGLRVTLVMRRKEEPCVSTHLNFDLEIRWLKRKKECMSKG